MADPTNYSEHIYEQMKAQIQQAEGGSRYVKIIHSIEDLESLPACQIWLGNDSLENSLGNADQDSDFEQRSIEYEVALAFDVEKGKKFESDYQDKVFKWKDRLKLKIRDIAQSTYTHTVDSVEKYRINTYKYTIERMLSWPESDEGIGMILIEGKVEYEEIQL